MLATKQHFVTQPTNSSQDKVMGFAGLGEVMHVFYKHHCTSCDTKAHLNPSECQFLLEGLLLLFLSALRGLCFSVCVFDMHISESLSDAEY